VLKQPRVKVDILWFPGDVGRVRVLIDCGLHRTKHEGTKPFAEMLEVKR